MLIFSLHLFSLFLLSKRRNNLKVLQNFSSKPQKVSEISSKDDLRLRIANQLKNAFLRPENSSGHEKCENRLERIHYPYYAVQHFLFVIKKRFESIRASREIKCPRLQIERNERKRLLQSKQTIISRIACSIDRCSSQLFQ